MMWFLFFSNGYFYNLRLTAYVKPYISGFESIRHYKYALLPGGFTDYDKVREGTDYGFAADRQVDAIELYKSGKVEKLVVTGDGMQLIHEGIGMMAYKINFKELG